MLKEISQSEYDELYKSSYLSFMQSAKWAKVKAADGYSFKCFSAGDEIFMALIKSYPLFGEQAYIPRPQISGETVGELGKKFGVLLIDPDLGMQVDAKGAEVGRTIQPQTTLVIDIKQSEEEWFSQMSKSSRKEIRRALKAEEAGDVKVVVLDDSIFEECAGVIEEEAKGRFYGRDKEYFLKMREVFGEDALGFGVYVNDKCVGGTVGIVDRNQNRYCAIYAAISKDALREFKAGYLVKYHQWKTSKELGLEKLDLWGVETDPNHPWYNFSKFKFGFGGEVIKFPRQIRLFRNPFFRLAYKIKERGN